MDTGRLIHRVTLLQPQQRPLDSNLIQAPTNQWNLFGHVWANVKPLAGRELEIARSFQATVSHRITIRWQPCIDPSFQIIFGKRVFSVNAVLNTDEKGNFEERNTWLTLYCTELIGYSLFEATLSYVGYAVWQNENISLGTSDAENWILTKWRQVGSELESTWQVELSGSTPEGTYTRIKGSDETIYYSIQHVRGSQVLYPFGSSEEPQFSISTGATLYTDYLLQIIGIT